MQDYLSELPQEIVDWDPRLISINTNGFTNSHRYILSQLSSSHDVTFVQETRFRTPSLHDKVAYHWNRITNHEGLLFFEPPLYPDVSTSPATGGLATLIHPHSPLKDATEFPHENSTLRGRYLQIRCTLGALTFVLHNVYAPVACTDRAAFFDALTRDFPPHFLHIAGGDFNCILNKDLDSQTKSTGKDVYLVNRLDYVFCSSKNSAVPKKALPSTGLARLTHWRATHLPHIPQADHVGCQIITKRQSTRHGSGPWKAPPWLLKLPRAAEIIHGCLDRFLDKSPSFRNLAKAYDTLVSDIRKQLKEFHTQQ
ncbi:hypothetical protein As57867_020505, partial [Aphanomyces stellatus]